MLGASSNPELGWPRSTGSFSLPWNFSRAFKCFCVLLMMFVFQKFILSISLKQSRKELLYAAFSLAARDLLKSEINLSLSHIDTEPLN
jgi:hypothetical protein